MGTNSIAVLVGMKNRGIRPDHIDAQVASLSAHLGWDVTRGAEKKG